MHTYTHACTTRACIHTCRCERGTPLSSAASARTAAQAGPTEGGATLDEHVDKFFADGFSDDEPAAAGEEDGDGAAAAKASSAAGSAKGDSKGKDALKKLSLKSRLFGGKKKK